MSSASPERVYARSQANSTSFKPPISGNLRGKLEGKNFPKWECFVRLSASPQIVTSGRQITRFKVMSCPFKEDRKSTRLNSSHVSISYAVFCLKQKSTDRSR